MVSFDAPWGNYMLKELVETASPEAISWLPQTPGWLAVALVLLFILSRAAYRKLIDYKRNAYRRDALAWIEQLPTYREDNVATGYRQIPALIKTAALHHFSRIEVNNVKDDEWEVWLDEHCQNSRFRETCPHLLRQLAHAPRLDISKQQMQTLLLQTENWIANHGQRHA